MELLEIKAFIPEFFREDAVFKRDFSN